MRKDMERFRALLEHAPDPVLIAELPSMRLVLANGPALDALGYGLEEVQGLSVRDVVSRSAVEDLGAICQDTTGAPRFLSGGLVASDGTQSEGRIRVTFDGSGETTLAVLMASPGVVDEREEPAQVDDTDSRLRALADSVPVGLFFTDHRGEIQYTNAQWSRITGLGPEQARKGPWLGAVHVDDREATGAAWTQALETRTRFAQEFRFVTPAGHTVWVAGQSIPFGEATGQNVGHIGTLTDISDRKLAIAELEASEAKYRSIFENIVDVYYETNLEGEIVEVSPSIVGLGGFTREELIGRSMLAFYTDAESRSDLVGKLQSDGGVNDYEIVLKDRNGKPFHCSITARLARDEEGNPTKIIGSMRDISARKRAEELLRAQRASLELIARDAPLADILEHQIRVIESHAGGMRCSILLVSDEGDRLVEGAAPSLPHAYRQAVDGIAIGANQGCCGTAAHSKTREIASDIASDPRWEDFKDLALEHGLRACWSIPILSASGRVYGTFAMYYEEAKEPEAAHIDLVEGMVGITAIAIERKRVEEERIDLEKQIQQAQKLESMGVLAGGIAHDFNNLLTGILGYAGIARNILQAESSEALSHVQEIEKIARRAAHLTRQMLAYSGKGKFAPRPLNLNEHVGELAGLLEITLSKKARVRYDFDRTIPLIEADAAQLQQVAMNLITNASDSLGDAIGDILIRTSTLVADRDALASPFLEQDLPPGRYVFLEVADTGCGMDGDTLAKIFDPFFTTKFTGRGLGLSAVLGIVRGHGGTIQVNSEPGVGTTTRVLFPCLELHVEGAQAPSESDEVVDGAWRGTGTVLVVDDEEMVREMTALILEEFGFSVITAGDGLEGLEVLRAGHSDLSLILLDLTMPNMDGLEMLAALRNDGLDLPVLLMSGYNQEDVADRTADSDFAGFVHKPFLREDLAAAIRSALDRPEIVVK